MGKILPASTLFAVTIPFSGIGEYLKSHGQFLEVQKKSGSFAYLQKMAQGGNATTPREWVDSLAMLTIFLVINGILLFVPQYIPSGNKDGRNLSLLDGLLMGLAGAFCVHQSMPGNLVL